MGFFADFLGGAATSASGEISRRQAEQTKLDDEQRQQQLAIERTRAVEELKAQMAEQAATAKRTRTNEQMTAVDEAAPAVTRERQLAEMQARAPSATGDTMDIVKQRMSSGDVEKYYGVQDNVVSRLGDKLGVARKAGYADAEDQLAAAYKETVAQLKMQNDEAHRIRQDETANKRIETAAATAEAGRIASAEMLDKRLAANAARSGGSGVDSKAFNAINQLETQISKREEAIRKANPPSALDAINEVKLEAHARKVDALIEANPDIKRLRANRDVLERREYPAPEAKPGAPAPAPVAAAPAGKSSSPMRYTPGQTFKVGNATVTRVK